jgi:UDP-N-acetylmuramoyl-tripeptide--D-alanyl-D-alanine ligase
LRLRLSDVERATCGALHGGPDQALAFVSTDSRAQLKDALFVALSGERFDGHDFVLAAQEKGAAAVLVERLVPNCHLPQVVVPSTLEALGQLARYQRQRFSGKVAAVTGSAGKTTTRTMLATVLGQRYATHQPLKNFNNHVGVPLTILALRDDHQAAVLELGCSDFGEIRTLAEIAQPDLALVTNVGAAHLEKLGDLEGVARAKGELFAAMKPEGVCVVNIDDPWVAAMPSASTRRLTYGTAQRADVRLVSRHSTGAAQRLTLELMGSLVEVNLALGGRHNAFDALAAAAAALALGLEENHIRAGLEACRASPGRLALRQGRGGSVVIDDTYNANPSSMAASLEAADELCGEGRLFVVLGDMLELGASAEKAHTELGRAVAEVEPCALVVMGEYAQLVRDGAVEAGLELSRCHIAPHFDGAATAIDDELRSGDVVLVKGSRGMKMENVVRLLCGDRE